MTALNRLAKQIEYILHKKRALEAENEMLKRKIAMRTKAEDTIDALKKEKNRQYEEIKKLTKKIESLLK